jgi:hypothetical protein
MDEQQAVLLVHHSHTACIHRFSVQYPTSREKRDVSERIWMQRLSRADWSQGPFVCAAIRRVALDHNNIENNLPLLPYDDIFKSLTTPSALNVRTIHFSLRSITTYITYILNFTQQTLTTIMVATSFFRLSSAHFLTRVHRKLLFLSGFRSATSSPCTSLATFLERNDSPQRPLDDASFCSGTSSVIVSSCNVGSSASVSVATTLSVCSVSTDSSLVPTVSTSIAVGTNDTSLTTEGSTAGATIKLDRVTTATTVATTTVTTA